MGSFNMFCAVTQTPIKYEDRIVCLGLSVNKDETLSCWPRGAAITSLAIHGSYNDYGGIDYDDGQDVKIVQFLTDTPYIETRHEQGDERGINNSLYDIMLIHESVYQYIIDNHGRGHENQYYAERRAKNLEEYRGYMKELVDATGTTVGLDIDTFISDKNLSYSNPEHKHIFRTLMLASRAWKDLFFNYSEVTGFASHGWDKYELNDYIGETYYNEVGPIIESAMHFGYRLAPSMYAGQETSLTDREGLNKVIKKLRDEEIAERISWGYYDDAEEYGPQSLPTDFEPPEGWVDPRPGWHDEVAAATDA